MAIRARSHADCVHLSIEVSVAHTLPVGVFAFKFPPTLLARPSHPSFPRDPAKVKGLAEHVQRKRLHRRVGKRENADADGWRLFGGTCNGYVAGIRSSWRRRGTRYAKGKYFARNSPRHRRPHLRLPTAIELRVPSLRELQLLEFDCA